MFIGDRRQVELIESGGTVVQETRLYDPDRNETRSMRSKEDAHDYRYFPDPDLLPLELDDAFLDDCRASLPELPDAKRHRYENALGLSAYNAGVLTAEVETARWFEALLAVAAKAQRVALASAPAGVVGKVSAKGDAMSKGRRGAAPTPVAAATSAMALYEQVKDFIARKIQEGVWRAGDRLPSESELVTQFGISRMTVNRALRELSEQGRIVRVAGVGSFVAEEKPQSTLLQIANLASEIRQRGHDYRCDVLAVERVSASLEVAAALDLRTGESVFIRCACTLQMACQCSWKTATSTPARCRSLPRRTSRCCSLQSTWYAMCRSIRWNTWWTR